MFAGQLTTMPGGNQLRGEFLASDPAGMTVRYFAPVGFAIDYGDGAAAGTIPAAGYIDHAYTAAGTFNVTLNTPAPARLAGRGTVNVPRGPWTPSRPFTAADEGPETPDGSGGAAVAGAAGRTGTTAPSTSNRSPTTKGSTS
jgi:hypothetical protein